MRSGGPVPFSTVGSIRALRVQEEGDGRSPQIMESHMTYTVDQSGLVTIIQRPFIPGRRMQQALTEDQS